MKRIISITMTLLLSICLIGTSVNVPCCDNYAYATEATEDFTSQKIDGVKASINWCGNMQIFWGPIAYADAYQVYKSTSKNGKYKRIATVKFDDNLYCYDDNTKSGKMYYYKVRAYRTVDGVKQYTQYSDVASRRATEGPLDIYSATMTSKGKVKVEVGFLFDCSGYKIYSYDSSTGEKKLLKTVKGNQKREVTFTLKNPKDSITLVARNYIIKNDKKYYGDYGNYFTAFSNGNEEVKINNKNLRKIVKKAVGSGKITKNKLASIWSIEVDPNEDDCDLSDCTKSDFSFLKYCSKLNELNLSYCDLSDISYILDNLSDANNIEELDLSYNHLRNLDGIEKLKKLEEADFQCNMLTTINGVEKLDNLRKLNIGDSRILDFSPIRNMNHRMVLYYYAFNGFDAWNNEIKNDPTNCKEYIEICEEKYIDDLYWSCNEDVAEGEELLDSIISRTINDNMTDYQKIKVLHDYIVNNFTYGHLSYQEPSYHLDFYWSLYYNKGVCADYALAYGALLSRAGIKSYYVTSDYGAGHAWNIVELDNQYYHVDCTWDDPTGGSLRYDYFLISDAQMNANRYYPWDTSKYPACPYNYS